MGTSPFPKHQQIKALHRTTLCSLLVAAGLASHAAAQAADPPPLSAIDWLSNSIAETPPEVATDTSAAAAPPPSITVMSLDAPVADTAGLIEAEAIGLTRQLWGRSSASDLSRALAQFADAPDPPPSALRFVTELMQARFDPPIDAAIEDRFFLARVDRLLAVGHFDAANALILEAGASEPQRFRRAFDIALLTGKETDACRIIEETPDLSPTYPTRIFCLARLGQWDVAALTLGNAETLGILTPEEDKLLLHFLDPELFEGEPVPPAPQLPSPLLFRIYEAVGERIPTDQLPVAFAVTDLTETVGWKTRLRAVERLAAVEALPFETLIEVYTDRSPAASGGIWERVRALQALLNARRGRGGQLDATLQNAWAAAHDAGYAAAFARWFAPQLEGVTLDGPTAHLAFEMALLAGRVDLAERFANASPEDRFLLALARGDANMPPAGDAFGRAVRRGLSAIGPGRTYDALLNDNRQGEALFRALTDLSEGAAGNPDGTANALAVLRHLGLDDLARQIAVELVLLEGAA